MAEKQRLEAHQAQNEMKNPHHDIKKIRPYLLNGFKTGIDLAL